MTKQLMLLVLIGILLLNRNFVSAQSNEAKFLLDTAITIMKNRAVHANTVDWATIEKNALAKAEDVTNPYQLGPAIRYLFESIDDFHGSFSYRDSTFKWLHNQPVLSDSITNEFKKGVVIRTMLLEKNIGYLRIPSMSVTDMSAKAQRLNDSLCSLLSKNIRGIVLDLRLNGGGAMFPMILGVEQLLAKGNIGSFEDRKKENWYLRDNGFYVDTTLTTKINPTCNIDAQNIPVVMLISPVTGSSAEFLVISFKGRKNTILLGSKTAGYITANAGFTISNSASMLLSVGYGVDRNGKIYKESIEPDIPFTSVDKFNDIKNDEKVTVAVKWLKEQLTLKQN